MTWTTLLLITITTYASFCHAELNLSSIPIPGLDDVAAIKERCDRKGGKDAYDNVKTAKAQLETCVKGLIDIEVAKNELEEAKKTGSMDEVFGKYCNKRPQAKECVLSFIDSIKPCLEETEKQALNVTLGVVKQLSEFVCFRDGDRIAMFVAEGGFECLQLHTEGIQACVNSTLKLNASMTAPNPNSVLDLFMDKKKCDDLTTVQTCVVAELEKCKDSTPANIIDALFRFVKKSACTGKTRRSLSRPPNRLLMELPGELD